MATSHQSTRSLLQRVNEIRESAELSERFGLSFEDEEDVKDADVFEADFRDTLYEIADLQEARAPKPFIGKSDGFNWAVKIDGVDNQFPTYSFGRRLDDQRKAVEWAKTAKTAYADAKGKATMGAVRKWIKEVRPSEFFAKWEPDSSSYKNDSVEISYKK
jgi:hypothetical protein